MLNKNLYPLLKLIQEHKYLSSEDIKVIFKNKYSVFTFSKELKYFIDNGLLAPMDYNVTLENGIPINCKLTLTIAGENAITEYEEKIKDNKFNKRVSISAILISVIALIVSIISLFK